MPTIDIRKITEGLSPTWTGYLRGWDRTLRAANDPETTRYSCLLAAAQLGRYLGTECDEFDAPQAADDPRLVGLGHVEGFQAWMVDTRSASTALNKRKSLQCLTCAPTGGGTASRTSGNAPAATPAT